MVKYSNVQLGIIGENYACKSYSELGYKIIVRNWRYSKLGEIDIIVCKNRTLIFSEVKTRSDASFALPCLAVNKGKQRRIIKLAKAFVLCNPYYRYHNIRFDVCQVTVDKRGEFSVDIIENAFFCCG